MVQLVDKAFLKDGPGCFLVVQYSRKNASEAADDTEKILEMIRNGVVTTAQLVPFTEALFCSKQVH